MKNTGPELTEGGSIVDYLCEDQIDYVADKLAKIVAEAQLADRIAEELKERVEECLGELPCVVEADIFDCFTEQFEQCLKEAIKGLREDGLRLTVDFSELPIEVRELKHQCIDKERDLAWNAEELIELEDDD